MPFANDLLKSPDSPASRTTRTHWVEPHIHDDAISPEVSRHKCLIYEGHPSDQLPVVVPFLKNGLHENWRCLYIASPEMVDMVGAELSSRRVDVNYETDRGALVLSSERGHLANGEFHPQEMVEHLCRLAERAVNDGFQGLSATGDMRWELGEDRNFSRLLEYEALLEEALRDKPIRGICQYHRDLLPPQAIHDALLTHRSIYVGGALDQDNLYYMPPELLLKSRDDYDTGERGQWMCQQIIRVLKAERTRDKALSELQESEAEQRRLAEQLAEANRDLERRVAERTSELQIANQNLEAFSYSVSHDLRGPLQSISSLSELINLKYGETLGKEGQTYLARMAANTRHMGDLIEGLLTLGRVLKTELHRQPVDLGAMARSILDEIRAAKPERNVDLVIGGGLRAYADPVLLRAALENLITNAWKFTAKREQGRIVLDKTTNGDRETVFFVKDNGAGFEMRNAHRLFGAFQRLHEQEEFPGTGVGLATVQRIIARHGGRIWAKGEPGEGATFFFTVPARDFKSAG